MACFWLGVASTLDHFASRGRSFCNCAVQRTSTDKLGMRTDDENLSLNLTRAAASSHPPPPIYLNSGLLNPDMKTYVNACIQFSNGDTAFIYANEIAGARQVT